jgi:hypothetical protein
VVEGRDANAEDLQVALDEADAVDVRGNRSVAIRRSNGDDLVTLA